MYERELAAVQRWVDETDRIALQHFGAASEPKADGTPVTAGDRAVEEYLRRAIEREFPGDAIVGEEQGETGEGPRRWIIDPIDGTKNYARGVPVFATLIALQDEGGRILALGMVSAPALHARWWATEGSGAFANGEPIRVSSTSRLDEADLCTGGVDWALREGRSEQLTTLLERVRRHRAFGDFWGAMLVAQGSMDAMVEFAPLKLWDVAACNKVVVEAGGRATNIDGEHEVAPSPVVTTNRVLHDELLTVLREHQY